MLFMLFLVTSGVALAIGFVLGRIWEIRLGADIDWTMSDTLGSLCRIDQPTILLATR
jgi:hypothetical protein